LNRIIAALLPYAPRALVRRLSRHYIAGERLEDAVRTVRALMDQGACATIDVLGEEVVSKEQTRRAVATYREVLGAIRREGLEANISLKPTHLGLKLDPELCLANIRELVEEAERIGSFVRIDMEDASCTDATLAIYRRLRQRHENVGTVLQAYHRRTIADVNALLPLAPNLRICKGIYDEPRRVAYRDPEVIRASFTHAVERLLERGCYVAVATHDERLVFEALRTIDRLGIDHGRYELQMLLGVEEELRRIVIEQGHRLRVYVPFGHEWRAYALRRLRENPTLVGHLLRQMWRRRRTRALGEPAQNLKLPPRTTKRNERLTSSASPDVSLCREP
jgi:proline dehydrogenase